ncbi:DUF2252 domain-containing protein [Bradyrhizobium sp. MOS001]|uniref:DUF2252 family protein n=1 Tax=Bradyrhizobium sp. MOS001 TaxID=2133948 RepID=UPI0010754F4F|nr:DUF2252 family protein [Bradyrhizobium sp. MOS001]TFW55924.1 DUF2252 domain-containing protein [Bradyrhizobium sp. MOS001]
MTFVEEITAYENWMRTVCDVVEDDLERKHERMSKNAFKFLRATFFRWAHAVKATAPEILGLPAPLAVGDVHVENFGTWRDAETRLVWGVNDYDDAAEIPYASDILRLTVSVRLADFSVGNRDAAQAIFEGYGDGLRDPGPTLLDQKEMWMRDYVAVTDKQRESFWNEIDGYPDASPSSEAKTALLASLPAGSEFERFARASKGGGSLGRPRFVAVARWRGGRIAREAKALVSSGWDWAAGNPDRSSKLDDVMNGVTSAPDPFLHTARGFIVRRIAADTRKLERDSDFDQKLDTKLLRAMGSEIGSIHASTSRLKEAILGDLERRDPSWLYETAKATASAVEADFTEWSVSNA